MKRITLFRIIRENLARKPFRTAAMIFLVGLLTFSLYTVSYITDSMEKGLSSSVEHLNADIIVVPGDYDGGIKDALLLGTPITVKFQQNWADQVGSISGVKEVLPQFYVATLAKSCCDAPVQLIAYDTASTYVQPLVEEAYSGTLGDYEIIVGSALSYEVGDGALFYGERFRVVGKMRETGMGFDASALMSTKTAYDLSHTDIAKDYFYLEDPENMVSSLLIRVEEGVDSAEVARSIRETMTGEDVLVYTTREFVEESREQVRVYNGFSAFLLTVLYITAAFAIIVLFCITINERQKEFGILSSIGADGTKIMLIIAGEALAIMLLGSLSGVGLSAAGVHLLAQFLKQFSQLPLLYPGVQTQVILAGKCILGAAVSVAVGVGISCYRMNQIQPYLLVKENE